MRDLSHCGPLPRFDPRWRSSTVVDMAEEIVKYAYTRGLDKADIRRAHWERLPVLGDALLDAGCDSDEIISHCHVGHSAPWYTYVSGCWWRECWLLNVILGKDQPVACRRNASRRNPDLSEDLLLVLNPGSYALDRRYRGGLYRLALQDTFDPPVYAVEAQSESEAIDIFVDSEYGSSCHIDMSDKVACADYGYQMSRGDRLGLFEVDRPGWYDLNGNFSEKVLSEPSITDGGTHYDGDHLFLDFIDPADVVYLAPGLPKNGLPAAAYFDRKDCMICGALMFDTDDDAADTCSDDCNHALELLREESRRRIRKQLEAQ